MLTGVWTYCLCVVMHVLTYVLRPACVCEHNKRAAHTAEYRREP